MANSSTPILRIGHQVARSADPHAQIHPGPFRREPVALRTLLEIRQPKRPQVPVGNDFGSPIPICNHAEHAAGFIQEFGVLAQIILDAIVSVFGGMLPSVVNHLAVVRDRPSVMDGAGRIAEPVGDALHIMQVAIFRDQPGRVCETLFRCSTSNALRKRSRFPFLAVHLEIIPVILGWYGKGNNGKFGNPARY